MRIERKLWLGLMAGVAATPLASAPASAERQTWPGIVALTADKSSNALPIHCIRECTLTQSSTGGFTIEYCRRFRPWRFHGEPPTRRF